MACENLPRCLRSSDKCRPWASSNSPNGIVNNQWRCAHEVIRGLQGFFEVLVVKNLFFAERHRGR